MSLRPLLVGKGPEQYLVALGTQAGVKGQWKQEYWLMPG